MNYQKFPYYDKRVNNYDKTIFLNNNIQKIMALFISNPKNYEMINDISDDNEKQEYFLTKFNIFREKYYTFNLSRESDFDMYIYFYPLNIDKKGAVNICGGSGSRSNSAKKQFIGEYQEMQNLKKKIISYLTDKYGFEFSNLKPDPRVFIGYQEIWKNPNPEMIFKESYNLVIEKAYDDETLQKTITDNIDSILVPVKIRNKVCQKISNLKNVLINQQLEESKKQYLLKIEEDEKKYEENLKLKKLGNTDIPSPTSIIEVSRDIDGLDDEW